MKKSYSSDFFRKPKNSVLAQYFSIQEKYVKTNNQLKNFIKSTKGKININITNNIKYNYKNYNINLDNNSLIKIFRKINDKYFFIQDYLKIIITSVKRDVISLESKDYFDKYINILNNHKLFDISIKKGINCKIAISKESIQLIFKYLGFEFNEEIVDLIQIMLYEEITAYHSNEYKNVNELLCNIYNNNFGKNNFYIYNNNKNLYNPITNYSIKRINDMKNKNNEANTNDEYFIIRIKNAKDIKLEKKNKNLIDKLTIKSDFKFLCDKYYTNGEFSNKLVNFETKNRLERIKKLDIIAFDNYLFSGEKILNNILSTIENNKKDFNSKLSNENNYFISIKDINNNSKYINIQYIQLIYKKSLEYKQNNYINQQIFNYEIKDYLNQNITISINNKQIKNYLSKPSSEKYISILKDNQKYLVKADFFKNLIKNWKTLNKKHKFKIEYPIKEEKQFSLDEITIDEQNEIKNIEEKQNIILKNDNFKYIKKEIKNNVNINKENKKQIDAFSIRMKKEEGLIKSRNIKKIALTTYLDNNFRERKGSELINSETCDSNGSVYKLNRSMNLSNSFNSLPEKEFYSIRKVIKITKRERKNKDKGFKKYK